MGANGKNANVSKETSFYVTIDGKVVTLTDEQRKAWNKMVNDARRYARDFGACGQPDYRKCFGDCSLCRFQREGGFVYVDDHDRYIDGFANGRQTPAYSQKSPDQQVADEEAWEWLYREADITVKHGRDILFLSFQEGLSAHQIANRTGIAKSTVVDRLNKLLAFIRDHRDDLI